MTWRALVLVPCGTLLLVPACTDDTGATSSDESTSSSTLTSGMQTTTGLSASESDGGGTDQGDTLLGPRAEGVEAGRSMNGRFESG